MIQFLLSFLAGCLRVLPRHEELGADDEIMPSSVSVIEAQEAVVGATLDALSLVSVLGAELPVPTILALFRTMETAATPNLFLKVPYTLRFVDTLSFCECALLWNFLEHFFRL